jgi:hypothetical protein
MGLATTDVGAVATAVGDLASAAAQLQSEKNTAAEVEMKTAAILQAQMDRIVELLDAGTPEALLEIRKIAAS